MRTFDSAGCPHITSAKAIELELRKTALSTPM